MRARHVLLACLALGSACEESDPADGPTSSDGGGSMNNPEGGTGTDMDAGADTGPPDQDAGDAAVSANGTPPLEQETRTVRSGSRLKRRYYDGGEGAEAFAGIWDSELQTLCTFRPGEGGDLRCMPPLRTNVYYEDDGCTQPVHLVPEEDCELTYAYERTRPQACGVASEYTVYRVQEQAATPTGEFYAQGSRGCVSVGSADTGTFRQVARIPPEEFVRASYQDAPRADGMLARYVVADDGLRLFSSLRNAARDEPCSVDGAGTCVPSPASAIGGGVGAVFSDDACTVPLVNTPDGACPPTAVSQPGDLLDPESVCSGRSRTWFETGPAHEGTVYRLQGETCETWDLDVSMFAVGAPIDVDVFPAVQEVRLGEGRLRALQTADSAGVGAGLALQFWDEDRQRSCYPRRFAADGSYRCVADGDAQRSDTNFSDFQSSDCTGPLLAYLGCFGAPEYVFTFEPFVWCNPDSDSVQQVFALGDAFTGSSLYNRDPTTDECFENVIDEGSGPFYPVGELVDPATFPPLTLRTDP